VSEWEYSEIAYAPGRPTVAVSNGGRRAVVPVVIPDEFGWVAVTPTLNEMGAEGWELVAVVQELGVTKLFLKRRVAAEIPEVYRRNFG
jgi:hypothetical protein